MPTLAEKARAEAEQAEAEEQEDQPTEEPEAEPEPAGEPEPAHDPAEGLEEPTDQMIAELQAACSDHHDHVRQIMGGFVDTFVPCDDCNGIGLAIPKPTGPQFQHAQGADTCSVCAGLGELLTGSKRQGYELIQCVNCSGQGWVGAGNMPPAAAAQAAVESFPQQADGQQVPPASSQPPSTDPRVQALRDEGFIVLEKPNA